MVRASIAAALSGALGACTPDAHRVLLPPPPGDAVIELLAVKRNNELHVYAHPLTSRVFEVPLELGGNDAVELEAHTFARSLEPIGITEGELALAGEGEALSRSVPLGDSIFAALVTTDGASPWNASTAELVAGVRYKTTRIEPLDCLRTGGCFEPEGLECNVPCAAPDPPAPPMPPKAPTPPAVPVMSPCPDGWSLREDGDLAVCEPWPEGQRISCLDGQALFPSADQCARLGATCPSGQWPEDLPSGRSVVYVTANPMTPLGSGTIDDPYAALTDAIANAAEGALIVLSKGTHLIPRITIDRSVELAGACVEETIIRPIPSVRGTWITTNAETVIVRDASIGTTGTGFSVTGGTLELSSLEITATSTFAGYRAVAASGAGIARIRRVRVAGSAGTALHAFGGGTLTATSVAISGFADPAITSDNAGTTVEVYDASIAGAKGPAARTGGRMTIGRSVLEDAAGFGAYATDGGSTLIVRDTLIRDTRGYGLRISAGASAIAERVTIEHASSAGVEIVSGGASVTARDLVVLNVDEDPVRDSGGQGIDVVGGGLDAQRVWIEDVAESGIECGSSCTATVSDAQILTVRGAGDRRLAGVGLGVYETGEGRFSRIHVERTEKQGIERASFAPESSSRSFVLEDAAVLECGPGVTAIYVDDVATATIARVYVGNATGHGIELRPIRDGGRAHLVLEDAAVHLEEGHSGIVLVHDDPKDAAVVIRRAYIGARRDVGLEMRAVDVMLTDVEVVGNGLVESASNRPALSMRGGSNVHGERVAIYDSAGHGILADDAMTSAVFSDLLVTATMCTTECIDASDGAGLLIVDGASVALERFRIELSDTVGIHVDANESKLSLVTGEVASNHLGLLIHSVLDVRGLATRVRMTDQEVNIVYAP